MLKYNNSVIKPVQLFNHADLVTIRSNAEAARNAYSSLSNTSSSSSLNTPFRSAVKPPTPPTKPVSELGAMLTSAGQPPVNSSRSQPKGHSNPYARPLSAKDIVNDIQNQKVRKTASNIGGISTAANGNSGTPMFGFQMNAFMRPQSAVKKDSTSPQQKVSPKPGDVRENKADSQSETSKAVTTKRAIPPTKLEREVDLSESLGSNSSTSVINLKRNQFGPSKRDTSSVTQTSGSSIVGSSDPSRINTSSHSTEVKPDAKVVTQTTDAGTSTTVSKTVMYAKPVSSLPRPGSQAPRSNSSTPDSLNKVRNLNYTPTKPYSEVMDPTPVTGKPPISATTKTVQTTETALNKGTTYMAPSNIGKSYDKQNSNNSVKSSGSNLSTIFYRKGSKEEIVLHEQRPPVVGAAAQPGKGMEKDVLGSSTTLGSDIEDEYEESENCTPSG